MSRPPLSQGERDQLEWIERAERRAILPLRIVMFGVMAMIWQWSHGWSLPPMPVFVVFSLYATALIFSIYMQVGKRLEGNQIQAHSLSTLIVDGLFIASLFYLDSGSGPTQQISSDYYVFFFLLMLRGYAVLQRQRDQLIINAIVLAVFVVLFISVQPTANPLAMHSEVLRALAVKTSLIIMVMALSWFLLGTLNRQRSELMGIRERLLRSENLATLGEIVAGVAHEINNPVGIISAYADFLIKRANEAPALEEDFRVIRSEAERCQQIVKQLLSFANPQTSQPQRIDLVALNEEVLHLLFLDKKNSLIDTAVHAAAGLPNVIGDAVQLKQALLNIYMNARHAMGNEGRIEVEIHVDPEAKHRVKIAIRDTGPGIPEEVLGRLFEPFYSSKDGGTGLGLAITKRIIEAHDGTIEARNDPRGGAVFTLRLRVAK